MQDCAGSATQAVKLLTLLKYTTMFNHKIQPNMINEDGTKNHFVWRLSQADRMKQYQIEREWKRERAKQLRQEKRYQIKIQKEIEKLNTFLAKY